MLENSQIGVLMTLMFRIEIVGKDLHPIYLTQLHKKITKIQYCFFRLLLSIKKDTIKIDKHQLQIE